MCNPRLLPARGAWRAVLAAAWIAAGCSGSSALDAPDAGRTLAYEPGLPNFDLEAVATWREGAPGIDVYLGLPPLSLVFVRTAGGYEARYERTIRLLGRERRDVLAEVIARDTVRVEAYEATRSTRALVVQERMAAAPGDYVVEVTLVDAGSDKQAVRRQGVEIVPVEPGRPHISRVRLAARRPEGFAPIVSLHVPASIDSLRSIVELYDLGTPVDVTLRLLRFTTDTTVAAPPYWLAPTRGSLVYRGVDYGDPDTLQVSRRRIDDLEGEAVVEFDLPDLSPGLYRAALVARVADAPGAEERVLLEAARDLSVKSPSFPHLELIEELVEALSYIAYEDELEHLRAAETPVEMKRRFDAFWGSLVPNRQVAANLIKLYYGRVEEANLYFTGYKEGWKTDRGMLYVVLGPPVHVETRIDTEIWYYSYGDSDPGNTYVFERVHPYGRGDPFENYVLQRRPYYQHLWIRAVDRWREGAVL